MSGVGIELLAYGIAFAVGAPICYLCWRVARRRQRALETVARELGLEFWPRGGYPTAQFRSLSLVFTRNFFSGMYDDREVVAFDLRDSADDLNPQLGARVITIVTTRWYQPFDNALEPEGKLIIRPERAADKAAAAAGFTDIDFESHEFSRRFLVRSPDKKFAYAVVHARMMEHLLAYPEWWVEMNGPDLMATNNRRWEVGEYADRFREGVKLLSGFIDLIPDHVRKDLYEKGRLG